MQNSKVLVEVVKLLQTYRITYAQKHQFLGTLFELLLNDGFKQSEGQFFTPIPVARFIWDCLPLERLLSRTVEGKTLITPPAIIDYACGAGHFLTEGVEAVTDCMGRLGYDVLSDGNNHWAGACIYGIEKDYRLARVCKIALFLNGAGYGNIIFGDGLDNHTALDGRAGTFDILVANPPYSVKAFKSHLRLRNNTFASIGTLSDASGEIEVLFVERIAQLLRPGGVAAVILPASILSNTSASYIAAREQILQNFMIRAIVELGGRTFIATNTNTVILFLEKFDEPPRQKSVKRDVVDAVFGGEALADGWEDEPV